MGRSTLPIHIGNRTLSHSFHVLQNLQSACILGMDFLSLHGLVIDSAHNTLSWAPLLPLPIDIFAKADVTIPPQSEKFIKAKLSHSPPLSCSGVWVFKPLNTVPNAREGIVIPSNTGFYLPSSNPSNFPITIDRHAKIGTIELSLQREQISSLSTTLPDS